MSFLAQHPALVWFLFGIFCFVSEMVVPGFFIFFFGLGAWCAALCALAPFIPLSGQVLVFVVASVASLVLLRAKFQKLFQGKAHNGEDAGVNGVQEGLAEVVEDILPPAPGKVKFGGSYWQAVCTVPVRGGATVRVLARNNLSLTVEPLQEVDAIKGE